MKQLLFALSAIFPLVAFPNETDSIEQSFREIGQLDLDAYFFNLPRLLKENNWRSLAILGETALKVARVENLKEEEFAITDQLVSAYYKLGNFSRGLELVFRLQELSQEIKDKQKVANSFYKTSAVLRGYADSLEDQEEKLLMFQSARDFIQKSFQVASEYCSSNLFLLGKIYFNAGALEAQSVDGDIDVAIDCYKKAIFLFEQTLQSEYQQRTIIRLAKAYLLKNNVPKARSTLQKLDDESMPPMTRMHYFTVKGTLSIQDKDKEMALIYLSQAMDLAKFLSAKQDMIRITNLLNTASGL